MFFVLRLSVQISSGSCKQMLFVFNEGTLLLQYLERKKSSVDVLEKENRNGLSVMCYDCVLRQILHEKVHDVVVERLKKAYAQLRIGDPLDGEFSGLFDNNDFLSEAQSLSFS